jgi:hypothetical protein
VVHPAERDSLYGAQNPFKAIFYKAIAPKGAKGNMFMRITIPSNPFNPTKSWSKYFAPYKIKVYL